MFKKFKQKFKTFMTGKSGFSLVELIVVIAIMAVMAAVLAPALLGYVEKSRMQKDNSAMDEVVSAIQLSLADQEIYDEVLEHSVWDNVSCYIDKKDESQFADCKVSLKAANGNKKEQYMFGDEARLLDETVYYAAGNMRGLTITWSPNESGDTYDFANGILNKFVGRKTGILSENPELYNRLRSVIGDKLDTTSQTYRNSDYTVFIRVGSTGGSEAVMQDAIQVWGQFNGTNLAEKDHKYELSSGRVVGTAGANDATNNQANNNKDDVNFSESYVAPVSTLTSIEWELDSFNVAWIDGRQVWTDGTNIYCSYLNKHGVFEDGVWKPAPWHGKIYMSGINIWTDGTNIYGSSKQNGQYVLVGDTWEPKEWEGLDAFDGNCIWTDGKNIYYSNNVDSYGPVGNYVLKNGKWEPKVWNGFTPELGSHIWTDGSNVYYSYHIGNKQYVLNGDTWTKKTWTTPIFLTGGRFWTDGTYYYCTHNGITLIKRGDVWERITIDGVAMSTGNFVWTDGINYYYSATTTGQGVFS